VKARFALTFLPCFAVLLVLWQLSDFGAHYRQALLTVVQVLSPLTNGWTLQFEPAVSGAAVFRAANLQLPLVLQLPALSMALVPFASLVVATPGQTPVRVGLNVVGGSLVYFVLHVVIVLLYPFILTDPNFFKDTLGVFSGLMGFVVAPLALWFVLTYPALRSLWGLDRPR